MTAGHGKNRDDSITTRVTSLFGVAYPIIQGGMVWVAGWRLAAAVSEAGGLGLIGAGSMTQDVLREHVRKARQATAKPFGVNVPLLRGDASDLIRVAREEGVTIFFTSAGHPLTYTPSLKHERCTVVHVVASVKHARKCVEAGCDAVVAEGFEAGGHNGADEITTLALVPQVVDAVSIPVIAAGGIADGRGMAAAFALGAEGIQVGTRFAATVESSAHEIYKKQIVNADDTSTVLALKKVAPVRLLKTPFGLKALETDRRGASKEEQSALLGRKRERTGIFEGDVEEGEFEAGQSAGLVHDIPAAGTVIERMICEYRDALQRMPSPPSGGSHNAGVS